MNNESQEIAGQPLTVPDNPACEDLAASYDLLAKLLQQNGGVVSSIEFKRLMVSNLKFSEDLARECMREMKFLDAETANRIGKAGAKTFHHGRSFLSKEKHDEELAKTDREAAEKEEAAEIAPEPEVEPERESVQ